MSLQLTFRNMESSPVIEQYARQKVNDVLRKFRTYGINTRLTFEKDNQDHIVRCDIHLGDGTDIALHAVSESMFASIDKLVDRLQRQLAKEKSRRADHNQTRSKFDRLELSSALEEAMTASLSEPEIIDAADIIKYEQVRAASLSPRA